MAKRKIPVRSTHSHEDVWRYQAKHSGQDPPADVTLLDPDTQVIVTYTPSDEGQSGRWCRQNQSRPQLPEDLSLIVIRPPRRRFRKGKVFEARWRPDVKTSKFVTVGKPDARCPRCRRMRRLCRLPYSWQSGPGCKKHVQTKEVEVPHPYAGKVIATFSTTKLYGLAAGTVILYPNDNGWVWGTVYDYDLWREDQRAHVKAHRKAANERRRYLRRPTRLDRILSDEGWL